MKNRPNPRFPNSRQAFTLVEVLVAIVVSSIMFIGIVGLINFNFLYQNQQELRASAMDEMSHQMELIKRKWIYTVPPYYTVTITDNRTPDNPDDDTVGILRVQLYDRFGGALGAPSRTHGRVTVVMTVSWYGRGRFSTRLFRESLVGYLIP